MPDSNNVPSRDMAVATAAVAMVGAGIYFGLKALRPGIRLGDRLTLNRVSFEYRGEAAELYINWGLKKGVGDFNNGANLAGGVWAWGGPMKVGPDGDFKQYGFVPKRDFESQPVLHLDPKIFTPAVLHLDPEVLTKKYDTYVWLTFGKASADESKILVIDTDAWAVRIEVA